MDVAVLSRNGDELRETAAEIERLGRRAWVLVGDVTDALAVSGLIGSVPPVDVLIHAAGGNIPGSFLDVSAEHLDGLVALNVRGAFLVAQAVARSMVARADEGVIVFITSQMGHVGAPNRSVYCMTKHAVEGLTKALAIELAPNRIRVNAVAPTFIETSLTRPFLADEAFRADVLDRIPLGRIGQVDDVTGAVVFLASPAASLITGTSLLVDGGWTAQ
jgi:NAD(P)-dependent dehydrogenase (short-subunit alcohol dehydrogenase family)